MAIYEMTIRLADGRLTVTEGTTQRELLTTMVVNDGRMTEETAALLAKLVGTRMADAIREQAGAADVG